MKNLAVVVTHRNFQHHIIKHKATATAHRDIRNLSIYIYILYRLTSSVLVCPPHPTPQQILEFFSEKITHMDGICHGICHGSPTSPHSPLLPLPLLDDAERFGRVAPAAFGTAAGRASGPRTKVPKEISCHISSVEKSSVCFFGCKTTKLIGKRTGNAYHLGRSLMGIPSFTVCVQNWATKKW